jgi:ATP-dependent exoDNAse (exonuclease V) beta subunit
MSKLFALPDAQAPETLQLMTIHKAKGLEFDTVILPGLGRRPRGDSPPLLRWMETAEEAGAAGLLLAPIRATGADHDALYHYIGAREGEKDRNESGRLLYVAATRAKTQLHLLGSVACNDKGEMVLPDKRSLLALLWPMAEEEFRAGIESRAETAISHVPVARPGNLRRLQGDWTAPQLPLAVAWQAGTLPPLPGELPPVEFDWASETIRHVGTVVHRALQQIGREGLASWTPERLRALVPGFRLALARQGVPQEKLADAAQRVHEAVTRALQDKRAAWLFDASHQEVHSEYPLSFDDHGQLANVIIDRTFVDKDGVRWIIDYKTSTHEGGKLDEFLDREQDRYRGQLERYAAVLQKLESRPIRLGLYFPLLGRWREWEA